MEKYAKFEVPEEVLGDFVKEVSNRGLIATTGGRTRRDEIVVTIPYEKDNEDDIDELKQHLDDLIYEEFEADEGEEEEEEEEEEDEDRR